jgi:L-ascorbate metabolism protein UlaG (beta-lactamase superfamily)
VAVRAVPAVHDGRRTVGGRPYGTVGYLVRHGGLGIYFAGDTAWFAGMAHHVSEPDLALLPVWGWGRSLGPGHMGPADAAAAAAAVGARIAVPIHWGTFVPFGRRRRYGRLLRDPAGQFAEIAAASAPSVEVRVLRPGDRVSVGARALSRDRSPAASSAPTSGATKA